MRLPHDDFYVLDRQVGHGNRELLTVNTGGQDAVVFFTRKDAVEQYLDKRGGGWQVWILRRPELLRWLALAYRLGFTRAVIDPALCAGSVPVPIFRILVDSEEEG